MLPVLSASQISAFRDCQRKWGFKYIAGLEDPAGPAAALGTETHDTQLGPYLRGEMSTFDYTRTSGYIAAAALAYLPKPPIPADRIEKHLLLPSPSKRFSYQGYIDLWMPLGGMPDTPITAYPQVVDFKTTSNLKWAKTTETLSTDVQAMLYATWAMFSTGARQVDLVWLYMQTRGAHKALRTYLRVDGDHVAKQFPAIDATGVQIVDVIDAANKAVTDPTDAEAYVVATLEANPSACEMYGGCPYRHRCNLGPTQFIDSIAKGNPLMSTDSLLERMKAKRAAAGLPAPAPVAPAPDPAPTPAPDLPAWAKATTPYVGINPPEAKLPPAPPVHAAPAPTPAATEAAPAPKKRGRPAKAAPSAEAVIESMIAEETKAFAAAAVPGAEATMIRVVWGKETFQPLSYNSFDVGPFELTRTVPAGASVAQAYAQAYAELEALAERMREQKATSYAATLGKVVA